MNDNCELFEKLLPHQIHVSLEERLYELRKHGNINSYKYKTREKVKKIIIFFIYIKSRKIQKTE